MAKFTVTVTNVSSVEVEAASEDEAYRKIDKALSYGDANIMTQIQEASTGWEISAVDEEEGPRSTYGMGDEVGEPFLE